MDSILQRFLEHPSAHQMTYTEHLRRALYLSYRMGKASMAMLIHAVFPMVFQTTGSDAIRELHEEISPRSPPPSPSSPSSPSAIPIVSSLHELSHRVPSLTTA